MKILQIGAMVFLALGLTQTAYANHYGKDDMHCDRQHVMEDSDTNKDGAISHDEFTAAHQKMADEMFAKLDANKDGKIDQAERDAMKVKMGMHCKMKGHTMNNIAK